MQEHIKAETTGELKARVPIDHLPQDCEGECIYRFLYGNAELERRGAAYQSNYPED